MELRHLRYFAAVGESLHFGEAAAKLRIAQPSLSQQIRQLEAELKIELFKRTGRRVELTEAGRNFLEEARDILARADRAVLIARRSAGGEGGKLRVGVGYCMDQSALVKTVGLFNGRYPGIRIELQTMSVSLQLSALRNERLDLAFVRSTPADNAFNAEVLISEPLVAAIPRRHRLAGKRAVTLSSLADEPFVITSRELVPVYHDIVLKVCRESGFTPNPVHETDHLHLLLQFVGAGCGIALVPAFAQRIRPRGVAFATLRPSPPGLETAVAWRRQTPPPALIEFVKMARLVLGHQQRMVAAALQPRMRAPVSLTR